MMSPAVSGEQLGLFLLRKDSERRSTLHRVLTDYIGQVLHNINESLPQVYICTCAAVVSMHGVAHCAKWNEWEVKGFFENSNCCLLSCRLKSRASALSTSSSWSVACEKTSAPQTGSSWPTDSWSCALACMMMQCLSAACRRHSSASRTLYVTVKMQWLLLWAFQRLFIYTCTKCKSCIAKYTVMFHIGEEGATATASETPLDVCSG